VVVGKGEGGVGPERKRNGEMRKEEEGEDVSCISVNRVGEIWFSFPFF